MSAPKITEHRRERDQIKISRALISVSDKTGLEELAKALGAAGVEIVSTGSTAQKIRDAGVSVIEASEVTGFPEILDGRVKTLHPNVHGGLLADLRLESHEKQLNELEIKPFDLVVVNLYPFAETVASGAAPEDVVEQIDIGGPAMVRASAKNHANVAIVVSPERYAEIIDAVANGGTSFAQRRQLAAAAFAHTAEYDANVSDWFALQLAAENGTEGDAPEASFPASLSVEVSRESTLRYGENSHQQAALYRSDAGRGIAQARQLHGKEMSYNNYVDADAALRAAYDFAEPAVAIIKHANPCGIAVAPEGLDEASAIAEAHRRAHACDPLSAFGGVVAANREVSLEMAQTLSEIFTEVVVAPGFAEEAVSLLAQKKNIRLLAVPADFAREDIELRQISGGFLAQTPDTFPREGRISDKWELVTGEAADEQTLRDLEFAWKAARSVKSNAILLANEGASVGVGMGQVNRVDSCHLAVNRAGDRAAGSVAASDAFFPFADGLEVLTAANVRAVVQPGGSIRDDEVKAAAEKAGVTMYFTGERHFFH
ncbi:bifunctional phosphoribosylaminoimidazolecarboxamide formyltransferase/IMP cyclohydrolase [Gulosibacter molinativorax]|uniref:Bifunctional purine biosynthesis protein PurH n=1 Tax=Gulosibacter molinativorax TaxID=256821 RepID=A0ABT7C435_9MICO|nr:bifunctional phosphoribosylaminoimidazolecarboxamide formyltransferase/IMP cyclohydrolase [Gulosibacter molinativorax]MDJ1369997.1 bifunctional phosphoribosylaminoimidazolecarboxamide formyltransferase/IMP cyclohydrolase PurH [Gulosibacter molinativorax]QUY63813.1 Bifunctional purine biosynthesis protein PurH [Gulosibacter molinativorax]